MSWIAVTREVADSIVHCELSHMTRQAIDIARARAQHAEYEAALRELGCRVLRAPAAPGHPDSVFIEDTAIVLPEIAVITRPGASSRRGEVAAVAETLAAYRRVVPMAAPGTVDGGDVLVAGRRVFVGRSARTNEAGVAMLQALLSPLGYDVVAVSVHGCLHLKSAATEVAEGVLLVQPRWVNPAAFAGLETLEVDPAEPNAANALRIGPRVIYPTAFPRTRERLSAQGIDVRCVPADELAKAEGAVTCCSLVFWVSRDL